MPSEEPYIVNDGGILPPEKLLRVTKDLMEEVGKDAGFVLLFFPIDDPGEEKKRKCQLASNAPPDMVARLLQILGQASREHPLIKEPHECQG